MSRAFRLLLSLVVVLAFSAELKAQYCSNATITGTFGYRYFGYFTAPNGALAPTAALGVAKINNGAVTASWSQSFGGEIHRITGTGKATVNPDCTGSLVFEVPGYVTFKTEFIVLDEGKEIHMMPVEPAGFVLTGELKRISHGAPR